jgi:uncharacterized protein YbaR (Trm112 family)
MSDEPSGRASEQKGEGPEAAGPSEERVDRKLLELLVCPLTKTSLDYDEKRQELISRKARLAYPIRRGVPHMLPSEARHLDE